MFDNFMLEGLIARMDNLTQSLKKVCLLVLGGLFLVTGWQVEAQTAKDKGTKDRDKKATNTDKKKDSKKTGKKDQKKTTLEKKIWPENSSGSV